MSSYGQRGRDLLLELQRSDFLPPYNDEAVRGCWQEIQLHFESLQDLVAASTASKKSSSSTGNNDDNDTPPKPSLETRPSLLLHDAAIRRLKRCLLAYHNARLRTLLKQPSSSLLLQQQLSSSSSHHANQALLAESEVDFLRDHHALVSNHANTLNLDLQNSMHDPPNEDDLVQVRVLANSDIGRLVLPNGGGTTVSFRPGTLHCLPRSQVEALIRLGHVEQIDGEEAY